MAIIKDDIVLTPTRLALDTIAIGEALLEADFEEARFRCQLLRHQADDLGYADVAQAALRVFLLLPHDHTRPAPGVGIAMLRLRDSVDGCR